MTFLTLSQSRAHSRLSLEPVLVLISVTVLAGLALADRAVAWAIGEFPSSAMLWELRFEFLRPIGVYYDLALLSASDLSPRQFAGFVLMTAALTGFAALSRVRLFRALASHAVCGAALVLWACSLEYRQGVYAPAGAPSDLYALVGAVLVLPAAFLCLKVHAEYVGWDPVRSTSARRVKIAWRRLRRLVETKGYDMLAKLDGASHPVRAVARNRARR
jgi:hypothetical protein